MKLDLKVCLMSFVLLGGLFTASPAPAAEICTPINTPTKAENNLTVTMKAINLAERSSTNLVQIIYSIANIGNASSIGEGSFELLFEDGTSQPQYGIFNKVQPQNTRELDYTWELPKSKNPISVVYLSGLAPQTPLESRLSWAITGKSCLISILIEKVKAEKTAAQRLIAEREALKKEASESSRANLKILVDQAIAYKQELITRISGDIKRNPSSGAKLNPFLGEIESFGPINDVNYKDAEKAFYEISAQVEQIQLQIANSSKSITCVKGKVAKKVTAIKPKCPAGFKKK
jgi:hypothetical protein